MIYFMRCADGYRSDGDCAVSDPLSTRIAGYLWDEPADFTELATALKTTGHAGGDYTVALLLALDNLLERRVIAKRRGLYCLTAQGRTQMTRRNPVVCGTGDGHTW